MKIRLKGNTIRFRLTRSEVERLSSGAALRDRIEFSPSRHLTWLLAPAPAITAIEADFVDATIAVRLPQSQVQNWAETQAVGLYGHPGELEVAVEKDFRCLTRSGLPEEADAFPNPHDAAKC